MSFLPEQLSSLLLFRLLFKVLQKLHLASGVGEGGGVFIFRSPDAMEGVEGLIRKGDLLKRGSLHCSKIMSFFEQILN